MFTGISLPKSVAETRTAYPGFDGLNGVCRGVLVSLIYNRGPGLIGARRREMAAIAGHIKNGNLTAVAAELVAMKRLWLDARGLRDRRDAEARLWLKGLG